MITSGVHPTSEGDSLSGVILAQAIAGGGAVHKGGGGYPKCAVIPAWIGERGFLGAPDFFQHSVDLDSPLDHFLDFIDLFAVPREGFDRHGVDATGDIIAV